MSNICSHHIYMKMLLNLADHYNKASSEQIAVHSLLVACFCCSLGGWRVSEKTASFGQDYWCQCFTATHDGQTMAALYRSVPEMN